MKVEEVLKKLERIYHENRLSHVYLVETNDIGQAEESLKNFLKLLACNENYEQNCNKCNICHLLETNMLPSLIIIEPDGKNIKKEQVLDLKRKFSTIPVITKNNIYIIRNAEKLNNSSANTILKFIEEPNKNIFGFLITNNINNVIPTIKSRCEVIKLFYDIVNEDIDLEMLEIIKEYIYKIEVEKDDKIINNKIILQKYSDREDIVLIFKKILSIYENVIKGNNEDDFEYLNKLNYQELEKRINLVINFLHDITMNANIELLLDCFVIELGGEYE